MARIKICGLMRMEDVEAVNLYRPDYVGFIFAPSRRRITAGMAENMARRLDDGIQRVGVFVDENREKIAKITESGIINVVQLHGHESDDDVTWLAKRTGVPIIKSVSVRTSDDIDRYRHNPADYLLWDNGAGGSGEQFDWTHVHDVGRDFLLPVELIFPILKKHLNLIRIVWMFQAVLKQTVTKTRIKFIK